MPDRITLSDALGPGLAHLESIADEREHWTPAELAERLLTDRLFSTPDELDAWIIQLGELPAIDPDRVLEHPAGVLSRMARLRSATDALKLMTWPDVLDARARLEGQDAASRMAADRPDAAQAVDRALHAADEAADARLLEGGE